MLKVRGKGSISAAIVADSISPEGKRLVTYELEYPRMVHAEMMTHRQLSKNAASSRAIPIKTLIKMVRENPAMPVHWGKNQSGMQAKEELKGAKLFMAKNAWILASKLAAGLASVLNKVGLHKQLTNRVLEPFQFIKVVCTGTEFENFFYLRDHADAQPEIAELAKVMREARDLSTPQRLEAGEWHLPYVSSEKKVGEERKYFTSSWAYTNVTMDLVKTEISLEDAIKLSASLCAQVSYRLADESLEKALKIYNMLVTMKPVHASPFEHQATPMVDEGFVQERDGSLGWANGVTHMDNDGDMWSGNFKSWIQNRQLIPGHVYKKVA